MHLAAPLRRLTEQVSSLSRSTGAGPASAIAAPACSLARGKCFSRESPRTRSAAGPAVPSAVFSAWRAEPCQSQQRSTESRHEDVKARSAAELSEWQPGHWRNERGDLKPRAWPDAWRRGRRAGEALRVLSHRRFVAARERYDRCEPLLHGITGKHMSRCFGRAMHHRMGRWERRVSSLPRPRPPSLTAPNCTRSTTIHLNLGLSTTLA